MASSHFGKGFLVGVAATVLIGGGAYRGLLYEAPKPTPVPVEAPIARTVTVSTQELAAIVTYEPRLWEMYDQKTLEAVLESQLNNYAGNLMLGRELLPYALEIDNLCVEQKISLINSTPEEP